MDFRAQRGEKKKPPPRGRRAWSQALPDNELVNAAVAVLHNVDVIDAGKEPLDVEDALSALRGDLAEHPTVDVDKPHGTIPDKATQLHCAAGRVGTEDDRTAGDILDAARRNASYVAYYDANVAQQAIYEPVLAEAAARYHSAYIPVPTHNTTDKYVKIATIIGASLFNGTLYFDEAIKNNPDWDEAAFQFFGFEKGSRINDDWPDALAEAIGLAKQHIVDISPQFKPVIAKRKRSKY